MSVHIDLKYLFRYYRFIETPGNRSVRREGERRTDIGNNLGHFSEVSIGSKRLVCNRDLGYHERFVNGFRICGIIQESMT